MFMLTKNRRSGCRIFPLALSLLICACAASRSPDPNSPARNAPRYPLPLTIEENRRERANLAWKRITQTPAGTDALAPELHPVTATILNIRNLSTPWRLPQVGARKVMTDEETRESLRRFIDSASDLLGTDLNQLSLIEIKGEGANLKKARYEQRPFVYPLRGGFGLVEIGFAPDNRILQLSSTAIPNNERLRRAVNELRSSIKIEEVGARIAGREFTLIDSASGNEQTMRIPSADQITVRELVIYPIVRKGESPTLDLHLAWEVSVPGSSSSAATSLSTRTFYVDAITNEILPLARDFGGR